MNNQNNQNNVYKQDISNVKMNGGMNVDNNEGKSNSAAFAEEEASSGYRLTWNIWKRMKMANEIIPLGCLYSPMHPCGVVNYEPITCLKCQSVLCPSSIVDQNNYSSWTCSFCGGRNQFSNEILNDPNFINNLDLAELQKENSTIEYLTSRTVPFPPVFVFIIDRCTYDEERHQAMIRGVRQTFDIITADSLVVFIEFGTNIELYSFSTKKIKTIYQYSGEIKYTKNDLRGIDDMKDLIVKKEEKFEQIIELIEKLEKDPFPVPNGFKNNRCTGAALSFAVSLLEGPFGECPVKHFLFTQGPCTYGPGVLSTLEISGDEKIDFNEAEEYYTSLAHRFSGLGHSVDIIAETAQDIGINELKKLISINGGALIMAQDFEESIKEKSLNCLYKKNEEGSLEVGFNANIVVKTSPNLTFKGFIGEGKFKNNTCKIGFLMPTANITMLFESSDMSALNTYGHIQIITTYQKDNKSVITRVTSISRIFSNDKDHIKSGFDWEAAGVLQSRIFSLKKYEKVLDLETAIDKHLICFTRRYAYYANGVPSTVRFDPDFNEYVQFIFFLRRSCIVQKEGFSSDEHAYFGLLINKIGVFDALKLIKPVLYQFHYQGEINEVPLDLSSLDPESMIVLDSFHNVLLWYGQDVESWKRQNIQENPDFSFFKESLEAANSFADSLCDNRLPTPQFKETAAGKSQERILLAQINPGNSGAIHTQRINFEKYFNTLAKHVTTNE